ncbi:putative transcriptional regulatory protein [Xylaria flabelliformis]|nr:putative transcriptional regulatory protein [Xylaria flabelliformis]
MFGTVDDAMTPDNTNPHQAPKRRKVAESCKLCRAKKTRCDGQHPACSSCAAKGLECEYNAATVPVSNVVLEGIESRLRKLEEQVSSPPAHGTGHDHSARPSELVSYPRWRPQPHGNLAIEPGGDPESESSVFLGENPTTQFMREITEMADAQSRGHLRHDPLWEQNDSPPVETDRLSMVVPERAVSDNLLDSYERLVYPLFPILHMPTFRNHYQRLWDPRKSGRFETQAEEAVFYATLNVVFALGCINDSATESHLKMRTADCFYRRARKILPLDALDHPSLGVAQYLLLMSTYLSYTKYANRCCNTLAVAIRVCHIIGLGVDADSSSPNQLNREMSRRVWHICLTLDRLYSSVFGLKTMVEVDCTVPFPSNIDDEYLKEEGIGTQPIGTPSIIEACLVSINIFQVIEDARKLKPCFSEQDIDLNELTQVLQLNGQIDKIEGSLPPHLKTCVIGTPSTPRDQVLRLQAEGVMTRMLYARLFLLRPYVLSAARRSLLNSATDDSLSQAPSSLHSTIRTEISKTCVQAATSAISTLHTNLRFKSRIFSCNAMFITLAAATVVIAASLVSELGISLDDVGPYNTTLTQAFKVLDEHMWQIEGGKNVKNRLARFLEIVRRENKRRLDETRNPDICSMNENGQAPNTDNIIEEFDFNDPLWTFQWAGWSALSDTMGPQYTFI